MYEELYEPLPQTEPYLKRLGLDTVPAADKKIWTGSSMRTSSMPPLRTLMCVNSRGLPPSPFPPYMKRSYGRNGVDTVTN